jgi:predicted NBD/HSP70 family sugar kinase
MDVKNLCDGLEATGILCWIAPRDIRPGQRYAEAIVDAIETCSVFVIVYSDSAPSSPHVLNEVELAASRSRPILLVRTGETNPAENKKIALFLSSHHWLDARGGGLPAHCDAIRRSLESLLKAEAATNQLLAERRPSEPQTGLTHISQISVPSSTAIGIDVGSSKILGTLVDVDTCGRVPTTRVFRAQVARPISARGIIDQTAELVEGLLAECNGVTPVGVGVALPGQVDPRVGLLRFGPSLNLRNVPFQTALSARFAGIPIRVDNDTRCATRCELRMGFGLGFTNFVCMFVGSGVGSGIVVNRNVVYGHGYSAGEIGHTKISPTGPPCNCGQVGCLETFVNDRAISGLARAKSIEWQSRELNTILAQLPEPITSRDVLRATEEGDQAALEVIGEVGEKLGMGIANYLNILNPDALVLGGGLVEGFFLYLVGPMSDAIQRNALATASHVPVIQSEFANDGAALGAALLFHPEEDWMS